MNVPLLDLKSQYASIKQDIQVVLEKICAEQSFILGAQVQNLEQNLATYIGTDHAIGVASGSDALLLSLMEVGVQPGDRVVTVPFTFFASAGVISRLHARPVFVDVTPDTFNLDPTRLADSLTSDVKAILPVHLFGQCADMETILQIADAQGIPVIEDACQAIGAARNGDPGRSLRTHGGLQLFPVEKFRGIRRRRVDYHARLAGSRATATLACAWEPIRISSSFNRDKQSVGCAASGHPSGKISAFG